MKANKSMKKRNFVMQKCQSVNKISNEKNINLLYRYKKINYDSKTINFIFQSIKKNINLNFNQTTSLDKLHYNATIKNKLSHPNTGNTNQVYI